MKISASSSGCSSFFSFKLQIMRMVIPPQILHLHLHLLLGLIFHVVLVMEEAKASPSAVSSAKMRTHNQHQNNQWVLRPSPGKDFSFTKLQEPEGTKYDPRPKDLDTVALKKKIGRNFDPEYMSIHPPQQELSANPNGTVKFPFKRNRKGRLVPLGHIPKSIRKLQYGSIAMPDGSKLRTRLSTKLRRKLVQFLWAYTSCPVFEKWRDLGVRFWPRWLKEGHCQSERSCSIPPGMSCKPSEAVYKVILRFHCTDWDRSKNCRWIPIRYPIITGCECSCQNNNDENESS